MSIETELVLVVCASIIALVAAFLAGRRMSVHVVVRPDPLMQEYIKSQLLWTALQTAQLRRMADAAEERNQAIKDTREALRKII